jgi:4-amino-4-deoxy-L-arabinose transferase-like glycosyltransferase
VLLLIAQYVPQRQIYDQTHSDTRRIFPNAYDIEITKDTYQRVFRWVLQSGNVQLFAKPNRGLSVMAIDINAAPLPVSPMPTLAVTMNGHEVVMPIQAGWRRLFFLVRPPAVTDGYTTFAYHVRNPAIQDERGALGFALHRVIVMPTRLVAIDWSWALYVVIIGVLVVGLWYRIRLPAVGLIGIGVLSVIGIRAILPFQEWYMPTEWRMLAIIAYPIVLYCVRPWCRPREFTPLQIAVALVLGVAALRWATPLGLIGLAMVYLWGPRTFTLTSQRDQAPSQTEQWVLPILIVCAIIGRFWDLNAIGMGLFRDEARHGALAEQILQGKYIVYSAWANLPAGYFYLSALPIALFGPSPFSIRFVAALAGVLTVPIVAWVVRPLWGRQVALIAAALVTMSLWHMSISRMGFPISLGPLVTLVAIGAVDRSMRLNQRLWPALGWAVLCGVMMGCMTLIYHSARLMPIVIGIFGIAFAWQRRLPWRTLVWVVGAILCATIVVAFPIVRYAIDESNGYWRRIEATSLTFWAKLNGQWWGVAHLHNLIAYAGMWFVQGDSNPRQYSYGLPQLDILTGSGFLLGVWLWWHQRRDWLTLAVGAWFGVTLLPGIFSVDAPHAWRSAENIIPTVIMAAWGIHALVQSMPLRQWHQWLLTVTFVGVIYSGGTYIAIQRTPIAYDAFDGNTSAAVQMAVRLNEPGTRLGIVSSLYKTDVGKFLLPGTSIFPVSMTIPSEPLNEKRQIVVTSADVFVNWQAPHFTYAALDPWGRLSYRVLCRGDCQTVADLITQTQTGTSGR